MKKKNLNYFDNKVRIRTKEELQIRKYEFLKICSILDKLKIKYFLQTGILLGAIRDNDLIPWDWDVELSVFSDDVIKKFDLLIQEIDNSGFSVERYLKESASLKIDFVGKLPEETTGYTIKGWNHDKNGKFFWRRTYKIPEYFLLSMQKIYFFEKYHYAPNPLEKFLEYQYGDWKKPLKTSNKNKYMTNKYSGINIPKYLFKLTKNNIVKLLSKSLKNVFKLF
jgi:hypothetical protein